MFGIAFFGIAFFGIAFGVVVVASTLLLGWGAPFIAIFGVVLVATALFFAFQRAAVEPTTDGEAPLSSAELDPQELVAVAPRLAGR